MSNLLHYPSWKILTYSKGPLLSLRNEIRINNYGFVNNLDYDPLALSPLLAIIGDSNIEAVMVPYSHTGAARLSRHMSIPGRVYTFSISGAQLSQYLAYADYAHTLFMSRTIVILVLGNDFDESVLEYTPTPGYHYFEDHNHDSFRLMRLDYEPNALKYGLGRSSLFCYLRNNLLALVRLRSLGRRMLGEKAHDEVFIGFTRPSFDAKRVADSEMAVNFFLEELPRRAGLPKERILLVIDGIRPHLYDPLMNEAGTRSYFGVMRAYFVSTSRSHGYEIIDMHSVFQEHFRAHGERFEYSTDNHRNALGHEVFAAAVANSSVFQHFLQQR